MFCYIHRECYRRTVPSVADLFPARFSRVNSRFITISIASFPVISFRQNLVSGIHIAVVMLTWVVQ
jgi:hypothetical protein